jgi:hypothetical protein
MTHLTAPFRWRATELANRPDWRFKGSPELLNLDAAALRAWMEPVITELTQGSGAALIQGLGELSEPDLRVLYLAIGRCIGSVDTTYGELYNVMDTGVSYLHFGAHRQLQARNPSPLDRPGLRATGAGGRGLADCVGRRRARPPGCPRP